MPNKPDAGDGLQPRLIRSVSRIPSSSNRANGEPEMIKGVIFDIGGVIAHDVWEHLLLDKPGGVGGGLSVAAKYSLPFDVVEKIGKKLWSAFDRRPEAEPGQWKELEKEYWTRFMTSFPVLHELTTVDELVEMTDDFIRPVNDGEMTSLLERLSASGVGLAICSNNNEFWSRRQMDKLDLHLFFEPSKVILSCHLGVTKSSPHFEMFYEASEVLGLDPQECAFVDDRIGNVIRAIECSMIGILFPSSEPRGARYLDDILRSLGR